MHGEPDLGAIQASLRVLNVARLAYPAIVLVIFVAAFITYGIKTAPNDGDKVQIHPMRGPGGRPLPIRRRSANQVKTAAAVTDVSPTTKTAFRIGQASVILTFLVNAGLILFQTVLNRDEEWWPGQNAVIYVVASTFVWLVVFISVMDCKPSPNIVHFVTWISAVPLDTIIIAASLRIYTVPHYEPRVGDQLGGRLRRSITGWETLEVIVNISRLVLLLGLSTAFMSVKYNFNKAEGSRSPGQNERTPLLDGNVEAGRQPNGQANGTAQRGQTTESKEQVDAWAKPTEVPNISWYAYLRGFVLLIPYLWPKKSIKLQLLAGTCFLIMIAQRVINVFVPVMVGRITDALSGDDGKGVRAPWLYIALYIMFRWLQGSQGILSAARSILWIPVEQYSYRAISTAAFEHVHNLSAEFHTGKRTGELISALNKGSSINSFLEMVTFQVGPMVFDLIVAIVYLTIKFDAYLGLVVAIVTFLYIYVTIRLAAWRVTLRRNFVNADREMEAVKNDSLHSWDTVKYFNAEEYEFSRYRKAIKTMQSYEYWVEVTLAYMNTVQGALFMVALLVASFIEAFEVAQGDQTVGNFVLLITYMTQLQGPLNFFGTFYRSIQSNLINAERMLELFKEQPHVVDRPGAKPLQECEGDIVFDNVTFSYDKRRPALNHLSFHCPPGTTTALVGESGGGKSTVMRLIFRYYNPDSGRILVDGIDVQDITLDSLRRFIGVVPQDCNMFNESIMYNLRYANQDASDEDIYNACRAASIHDRIMQFPDGYETRVGERGVRLSGGERQRVAIARTILKNPRITMLDEATAALDSETEEKIQESLNNLAEGRTMIIIAHRLSTIVNADQILVLSNGTVVERGTHEELIALGGKYASMWRKQSRAQKAAAEAAELRTRAKKALEEAEADSASVSEEEIEQAKRRDRGFTKGHKRVNFSESSHLRASWGVDDQSRGNDDRSESSQHDRGNSGKPPGHP
ncbi:ATP-binding cassette-type vacuolar membrane transporter Hmt1 [Exophiala dermatitidis]|uniref:ATP-binding cassette-type vacuolar membrane transporter Hmt1 n=1 Tax=Exophiala dermatitidis TaxID=5970 RepID=A0AAN6EWH2_EXODE|nr:ATP-binding cassette-type vacuolar membrane transporter Hmt1 [Exophiala dermatitidis]KAJ4523922.1 ATP-binding cassette-type vacuolar membrane transporter Hmt1 [Exophiala dermatitidis]KAJ4525806.1 ATP-binding cassette-type vacuolar membrane transporter Hmt1 [Exophiala dermatitidis]KAJ4537136.1 ATP-binding cassette-type vacuolar membrane transporter Hmt1 [Exophiala dermatitidis]KAJ4555266.1 ATP-binding cassette-type vacuolar membrane transporter Hmt1 [Exophiala dermatitidis]